MSVQAPNPNAIESPQRWHPVLELAAQEVFDSVLGRKLDLNTEPAFDDGLDVTAMVGLAGLLCGVITIRCSSRGGTRMVSRMLGVDREKAAPELWDVLGELCNMVAGNFKNKISGLGDGCVLSVPTVITGGNYNCHSLGNSTTLQVGFLFEGEQIVAGVKINS